MDVLKKDFANREDLAKYVKALSPWAQGVISPLVGGGVQANKLLSKIDPVAYGKTRNYGNGNVTKLSPYVHHGVITINDIRNYAVSKFSNNEKITKLIQELAWRDFWQRVAYAKPHWIWNDVEAYKTGFSASDYADELPEDIKQGTTNVALINAFIKELIQTGYVHNHARMYLASYVVHFRRIKWQAGARWFLEHLLDGDEASNNLSWQWVASTFSNKPYIFNLENVAKYFGTLVDTRAENNQILDATYEVLSLQLFPNLEVHYG